MKTIILNKNKIIDGRERAIGEIMIVDDTFPQSDIQRTIDETKEIEQVGITLPQPKEVKNVSAKQVPRGNNSR